MMISKYHAFKDIKDHLSTSKSIDIQNTINIRSLNNGAGVTQGGEVGEGVCGLEHQPQERAHQST